MTLKKMIEHYIKGDICIEGKISRKEIMDIAARDAEIKKIIPISLWENGYVGFYASDIADILERIDYICLEYLQEKYPNGHAVRELRYRLSYEQRMKNSYPGGVA